MGTPTPLGTLRGIRDPRGRASRQRPDFSWRGAAPEPDVQCGAVSSARNCIDTI